MELDITEEKRGALELIQRVPENLSKLLIVHAIPFVLNEKNYQALFQLLPGDGFRIWYSTYRIGNEQTILKARGGIPVLELRVAIKNEIKGTWDKIVQPELPPFHFSLAFTPFVSTRAIFEANTEYITIDFHFDLEFLIDLGVDCKALELFLKKVENDQPAELSPYPHACPSEMKDAVSAILHNKYSPAGKQILNKWKAGEILLSAMEAIIRTELLLPLPLKEGDIQKLQRARAVIEAHFPDWIGPKQICKLSELNQLKLKIGFKHLFHQTPYEFFQELKFRKARQLLLEGKESITNIAYLSGYKHGSSFSSEFKEVFGYSPKQIVKDGGY
jgi:AraC-like DNA-binding protein